MSNPPKEKVNDLTFSSAQSISHAAAKLRVALLELKELAPTREDLDNIVNELVKQEPTKAQESPILTFLNNGNFQLAVEIKTLYSKGEFGLMESILNPELITELGMQGMKQFELKNQQKFPKLMNKPDAKQIEVDKSLLVNNHETFEKFFKENYLKNYPPPLPTINNPLLLSKIFTHKSLRRSTAQVKEVALFTNEKLEFIGDSYMNFLVTKILCEWYPTLNEGSLSEIRQEIIKNSNISNWSKLYKLHQKLKVSDNLSINLNQIGNEKRFADVFEAYIGGLLEEKIHNEESILLWLKQLSLPIIKKFNDNPNFYLNQGFKKKNENDFNNRKRTFDDHRNDRYNNNNNNINNSINNNNNNNNNNSKRENKKSKPNQNEIKSIKNPDLSKYATGEMVNVEKDYVPQLYSMIGFAASKPQYTVNRFDKENNTTIYLCDLKMEGELIGRGLARNTKLAKKIAAGDAIENHANLVEKYHLRRKAIPKTAPSTTGVSKVLMKNFNNEIVNNDGPDNKTEDPRKHLKKT